MIKVALAVLGAVFLVGCAGVLPEAESQTNSPFDSFEAARAALTRAEPYSTSATELQRLGFDVASSQNVRQVPYPEIIGRLAPHPGVPLESMDRGVRDCILARQACRAYEFSMGQQMRRRVGGFLGDFFNFERTTRVSGWRFEALVLLREDTVLFRSYGGEPLISRIERQTNPLGPLQQAGEAVGGLLAR